MDGSPHRCIADINTTAIAPITRPPFSLFSLFLSSLRLFFSLSRFFLHFRRLLPSPLILFSSSPWSIAFLFIRFSPTGCVFYTFLAPSFLSSVHSSNQPSQPRSSHSHCHSPSIASPSLLQPHPVSLPYCIYILPN